MPKYVVKAPLNHDQKDYLPGDLVEMTESQAAMLQSVNVIGEEFVGETSDDELIEKIKAAATAEEVDALVGKIKRKAVVEAASARKTELA